MRGVVHLLQAADSSVPTLLIKGLSQSREGKTLKSFNANLGDIWKPFFVDVDPTMDEVHNVVELTSQRKLRTTHD